MFSFLTGKKDEKPAAEEASAAAPPPASAPATAASTDANPPVIPAGSGWDSGDDSPFTPPPAWNLDALTTPAPK